MCECYHVSGVRFQVVKVQSNRHTRGSLSYRFSSSSVLFGHEISRIHSETCLQSVLEWGFN